jgi:hypothetical protein
MATPNDEPVLEQGDFHLIRHDSLQTDNDVHRHPQTPVTLRCGHNEVTPMESREFIDMARNILDADSLTRERAVDEVADRLNSYSPAQVSTLATLLSGVAVSEKRSSTLEATLHAILELMSTGHVTLDHLAQLREIQLGQLSPELRGYVTDLLGS